MDVNDKLDELGALVAGARSMPMSSSCVLNRAEVLDVIEDVRRQLPLDLAKADGLLADAEGVLAAAHGQADEIVAGAQTERMELVSRTEVVRQAEREAGRIVDTAEQEAASMRREIDDYIDAKLANFEIVLAKTMDAVSRGREKIQGRRAVEELADLDLPDPDLPDPDEPQTP